MSKPKPRGWSKLEFKEHPDGKLGMQLMTGAYVNHLYVVQMTAHYYEPFGEVVHLWVRNNDASTYHDWSELQRIKNELCGDDCVAVEVFPPADDLLDSANIYHLWCWNPLRFRLPFEFKS